MKKTVLSGILLTLLFINTPCLQAEVPSTGSGQVQTYDQLIAAIRQARAASQTRVEQAVRQEKVREAWETGKLIDEYVLQHKERADYADQTLLRLARDLGTSETELRFMLQFARTYPIHWPADELSWSHYESLMALNDPEERKAVAEQAIKEKWNRNQVREEVKKRKAARKGTGSALPVGRQAPGGFLEENTLTAKPGKVGTYKIVKATVGPETGKWVIDLGFSNYYKTSKDLRFKEGAIVEVVSSLQGGGSSPSDKIRSLNESRGASPESLLYTYRAYVVRVLDGDTVEVVVDLGFGVRSVQTLRLRGLDCPELVSAEGKEAKAFVENLLAPSALTASDELSKTRRAALGAQATSVLVKTVKSDKYDRYLADIFVTDEEGQQWYLNNLLLEQGHAVRVSE